MSLLNEFQLQAIRDFKAAVRELLEDLDDSAFDVEDISTLMDDLNQAWVEVQAQLSEEKEEE